MKFTGFSALRVALTGAMLFLLPSSALPSASPPVPKAAGVYRSDRRVAGKTGATMDVSLGPDGSATVTEDTGKTTATLFGHWTDLGDQIRVTFDPAEGQPPEAPMTFQFAHNALQATSWNHAIWGKIVPPPMRRGYKVKEMYWFDTVR